MDKSDNCLETAQKIKDLRPLILSEWEVLVRRSIAPSQKETSLILLDHMPEILSKLETILESGYIDETEFGKAHGFQRAVLTHYSLDELLTEFSLLRETLINYIFPIENPECSKIIHRYIDILCKHSVLEFLQTLSLSKNFPIGTKDTENQELKESNLPTLN